MDIFFSVYSSPLVFLYAHLPFAEEPLWKQCWAAPASLPAPCFFSYPEKQIMGLNKGKEN